MTKAGEAEQTADLFSKQTWSCTAEGEAGEENGPNRPGGYCPAWGRNGQGVLWWTKLEIKKRKYNKKKYSVEVPVMKKIMMKQICDETQKLKLWQNSITQVVT